MHSAVAAKTEAAERSCGLNHAHVQETSGNGRIEGASEQKIWSEVSTQRGVSLGSSRDTKTADFCLSNVDERSNDVVVIFDSDIDIDIVERELVGVIKFLPACFPRREAVSVLDG